MTTAAPNPSEIAPTDLLSVVTHILEPAGWQTVAGRPSLFLRANTALLSTLRCTVTAASITVASVSMTFEEDRPLQLAVRPRGRDAFAAVCELFARHAGELDRLDYAFCVADLLRYVDHVDLECETTGLVPTVASFDKNGKKSGGAVRYEPAPPPAWPPPERARLALNQRRRAGGASDLLPWEPAQYQELPRLLAKDRRGNLSARLAHYEAKALLRPGDGFVRAIEGGRHSVCLPADDGGGAFAHSIGLGYLHDLPEILLVAPMPATIGATSRALALTVEAVAAALIGGVRLGPGDRYAAVADVVARTVRAEGRLDHASLAQSCFVIPPARLAERTLGAAAWFYANFMDTPAFPVLACLLQPPRIPADYGVPPPPPPARVPRAAAKGSRAAPRSAPTKRKRAPARSRRRGPAKKPAPKTRATKAVKKPRKARPRRR